MILINQTYKDKNNNIVEVVAINEVTPKDEFLSHGVMPCVEYLCSVKEWHIMNIEDFALMFEEV